MRADIERLAVAARGHDGVQAFLPAITPGTVEHWLRNEFYPDQESFLFAIADVLREEYQAIIDAGLILQVDDPDLPDGWQMFPEMTVPEYRRYAALRIEALNYALRGLPEEQVRLHICWGSHHGPHRDDIPLRDLVDLVLTVRAGCYSVEAANPRHEHEWAVWEETALPDGKSLMPGVAGHASDIIEHPELVAQRLIRFARLVGRENVIAGTDCGLGGRVGHPEIVWAKLTDLAAGAAWPPSASGPDGWEQVGAIADLLPNLGPCGGRCRGGRVPGRAVPEAGGAAGAAQAPSKPPAAAR